MGVSLVAAGLRLAGFGVAIGVLVGCSLYSSNKTLTFADAEGRVPDAVFADLGAGTIGKNWLMAQLGRPVHVEALNASSSVCTWALTRREHRHTKLFLIYNGNSVRSQREFLHVVFAGDEVLKHWQDRDELVNTAGLLNPRENARIEAQSSNPSQSLIVPRRPDSVTTVIRPATPAQPGPTPNVRAATPPVDSGYDL